MRFLQIGVKSNLEFNKTLIKVIRMFDEDENTNILVYSQEE